MTLVLTANTYHESGVYFMLLVVLHVSYNDATFITGYNEKCTKRAHDVSPEFFFL